MIYDVTKVLVEANPCKGHERYQLASGLHDPRVSLLYCEYCHVVETSQVREPRGVFVVVRRDVEQ